MDTDTQPAAVVLGASGTKDALGMLLLNLENDEAEVRQWLKTSFVSDAMLDTLASPDEDLKWSDVLKAVAPNVKRARLLLKGIRVVQAAARSLEKHWDAVLATAQDEIEATVVTPHLHVYEGVRVKEPETDAQDEDDRDEPPPPAPAPPQGPNHHEVLRLDARGRVKLEQFLVPAVQAIRERGDDWTASPSQMLRELEKRHPAMAAFLRENEYKVYELRTELRRRGWVGGGHGVWVLTALGGEVAKKGHE